MASKEATHRAAEELSHIPRGDLYQNVFRSRYHTQRLRDLTSDPTTPALKAIEEIAAGLRKSYPGFRPVYDPEFFGRPGGDPASAPYREL